MANAGRRGRPIAPLVLSAKERGSWRAKFVVTVLPDRYLDDRVILRCADGSASKDMAAELGHHRHTVRKRRRRFLNIAAMAC